MKRIVLAAAVSAVAGTGWLATRGGPAPNPAGTHAAVRRGDFRITILEQGTFAARDSIAIQVKPEAYNGPLTITRVVDAGSAVRKGDLLIEFDDAELRQQLAQAEIRVQTAKNDVVQASQDFRIQQADNRLNIERAEFGLEEAELNLRKWRELLSPKEIKEQEARISEAQNTFDEADANHKVLLQMRQEDLVSEAEVRRAELAAGKAGSELEFHRLSLRQMREYDHPLQLKRLENAVRDATSLLEGRRSAVEALTAQKQSALLRAESALQQAELQLEKLSRDLNLLRIPAPTDGIILYGDPNQMWVDSNFKIAVGEKANMHRTLLTLPDLSAFKVKLGVSEADINKVRPGQEASVRPEALPDLSMKAVIRTVSTVTGSNRWWQPEASGRFEVELDLQGIDPRLKPGMKCKVEIAVDVVAGSLHVPVDAVFEKDGRTVCHVLGDPRGTERIVRAGRSSADFVEILEGLQEGERVALYDPSRK